ncbi:MAG: response regulator transcription factor [Natronomonas sp.]
MQRNVDGPDDVSVLVVEDEEELLEIYEGYLRDEFTVHTTTKGSEALELVDEFDVLLLDRRMPEMAGDEVLDTLRERGDDIPVAMVTAVDPDLDIAQMPFDEYLTKPVDRRALVDTVKVLANRRRFEETSREFFRLAAKRASLEENEIAWADEEYTALLERIDDIRTALDGTVQELLDDRSVMADSIDPDPQEIRDLMDEINDHTLPDVVTRLLEEYFELNDARPLFIWKWVHRLAPQNELPCVDAEYADAVAVDKTLTILFITLLDDTLEKQGDRATFTQLSNVPFEHQSVDTDGVGVNSEAVELARRVWKTLDERLRSAPQYATYADLFQYDLIQAINSIEYSDIAIRRPDLATVDDLERYESHNMVMFGYADIDLMHSPADLRDELSTIREAIWTAQQMARIGNWVSTWEREIEEGDFGSGPVVYALENDVISLPELEAVQDDPDQLADVIDRIHRYGIETEFLSRWERNYYRLREIDDELEMIDLEPFVSGTEEILRYHLASRGLK